MKATSSSLNGAPSNSVFRVNDSVNRRNDEGDVWDERLLHEYCNNESFRIGNERKVTATITMVA